MKIFFHIILVVIYVTLNDKPLKKCMYFWVPSIECPKFTSLYMNFTTKRIMLVLQKSILDNIIPFIRKNKWSLLSLEMVHLYVFWAYILSLWVYLSQLYCLFFNRTYLHRKSTEVKSLVYFSGLYPWFASLFQSSLLYIFIAYILASWGVYFSRVKLDSA